MVTSPLIRTFSYHYREKLGTPVGKIPLHLGGICPNREKGGCIFCLAPSFTPGYLTSGDELTDQISAGKKHFLKGRFTRYFAYFQQETPTAVSAEFLLCHFEILLQDDECIGLIISTRPDSIDDQLLDGCAHLISTQGKDCLFELGLQSVHDTSLEMLNRNHSYADFRDAFERIRKYHQFEIGVHLILGIPGESVEQMTQSVNEVCDMGVDALKLHHLQVMKDTPLHRMYEAGEIELMRLHEYFDLLVRLIPLIPQRVVIHRLWASAHPNLLIAPKWDTLATELSQKLRSILTTKNLYQGKHLSS